MQAINKLILGTAQLGSHYGINNTSGKPSDSDAFEILQTAYSKNVRILDTAQAYGDAQALIGRFHVHNPDKQFLINTKISFNSAFSHLSKWIQDTLRLLHVKELNSCMFHSYLDYINNPNVVKELDKLKDNGHVRYWGVSIYTNEEFEDVIKLAEVDFIQIPFNIFDNYTLRGHLIEKANKKNIKIHIRSVFLQGLFFMDENKLPPKLVALKKNIHEFKLIAAEEGITLHEACLMYVGYFKNIENIILGIDSVEQLNSNIHALEKNAPTSFLHKINHLEITDKTLLLPINWK